ncbi:MAG TPA: hypothetical protein VMU26_07750 [Candidatus Polarisedimenticolia bacterium]|nr:hypothetical protein [Candidatus Polarisedimenticolia bacterium]
MKIRRRHYLLAICLLLLPYRVPAQTDAALQPFTVDHRKALLAHSPVDVSFLLDAPAGRHGFVRAQGGHFVTGYGKRIRFWGVNITDWSKGSVMIPSKDDAPLWAATLARFGVNCVRFQFLDLPAPRGLIDGKRDDTRALDPEAFDREDFFIAELEKRGIYINFNLLVGRPFKAGDGVQDYQKIREGAKGISLYDPRIIELQKEYAKQLLAHYNPYAKIEYRNDPAVAMVEINNENALGVGAHGPTPYYDRELARLYNTWLKKTFNPEDLKEVKEIAGVSGDDPVPLLQGRKEIETAPKPRFYAESRFFLDTQRGYWEDMRDYLTGTLGVKSLIMTTADHGHTSSGYPLLLATSSFDTNDGHTYWQHDWENKVKAPMVNDPFNSTVVELSRTPVAGKPYTVSEVNNPFPNDWASEGIPILAAYGDFQDWDAIIWYTFEPKASPDWKPYIGDAFDISLDPVKMPQLAAGALMFLRADVSPANSTVLRSYGRDQVFDSALLIPATDRPYFTLGFPLAIPLEHQSRIESLDGAPVPLFAAPKATNPIVSDTSQLAWYNSSAMAGLVTVDTPRSQALIGFVKANGKSVTNLSANVQNRFCTIWITSLESEPISRASRLLLTLGSRVENEGMRWNDRRSSLAEWGGSPTLIEPVMSRITLRNLDHAKTVSAQALDGSGQPTGEAIRAEKKAEGWDIPLGKIVTTWYEVVVTR